MSGTIVHPSPPEQPPLPPNLPNVVQESPQGMLIEDRIHKTRRQVKGIDIIAGLMTLAVGTLVYLFAAAIIDHWLVTGGLGFWGRLAFWLILILATGFYFFKYLWPSLVLSINPVYAAWTIEQSKPTLKNSLINFLLLRGRKNEMAPVIYQALEQRAASDLKEVNIDTAVDRRPILQLSYVLAGVVGVICLYLVLSPKSALTSAERILWPWSSLRAPTRVTIENVQPGNVVAYHGDTISIAADVYGLDEGEAVMVHYSTADKEIVDQVIPMSLEGGAFRHQLKFPSDTLGLQKNYSYFIAAGDYKTDIYRIETQIAPSIDIDKVAYHYPPYTGIQDISIAKQGDIRAYEGTEVTIHATANQPIARATIDFSGSGKGGIGMNVNDRTATGQFTLRMRQDDPTKPEYDFYQLRFIDKNKRENRRPIRYNIVVLRDLPPNVEIVEPQKDRDEVRVAEDGVLEIRIRAEDQDFGLRRVVLRMEKDQQRLNIQPLLDIRSSEKPFTGVFQDKQARYDFKPRNFKLKAGDRVEYWAEAEDCKVPTANITATEKKSILVVAPENAREKKDQQPSGAQRPGEQTDKDKSQQQSPDEKTDEKSDNKSDKTQPVDQKQSQDSEDTKAGEQGENGDKGEKNDKGQTDKNSNKNDKGNEGDKGEKNEQRSGESADKSQQPIDPNSNPGDAIQEILKDREKQEQKDQPKNQSADQNKNEQQQQKAGEQKSGEQKSGEQKSGEQKSGEPKSGEQKSGEQKSGEQKAGEQKSGEQKSGEQKSGEQKSGEQKAGEQKSGEQKAGEQKSGEQKSGEQKSGEQKSGEQKSGEQKSGEQKTGEQKTGEQKSDEQKSGEQNSGEQKSGEQKFGEQKAGEQKTGEQKTGEQKAGEQKSGEQKAGEQKSGEQKSGEQKATPQAQGANQQQPKQSDQAGQGKNKKRDEAQSPSTSPKQSDSKGDSAGDRSGGGEAGGGQQAKKPGTGADGSQTPTDKGGSQSDQRGQGQAGDKPGDQSQAQKPTGSDAKQESGKGSNGEKRPGGDAGGAQQQTSTSTGGEKQEKPSDGGQATGSQSSKEPSARGSGNPTTGGTQSTSDTNNIPPEEQDAMADEINKDYARKQTELALEHLEDQLAKDKPELLEKLGWTREQAQQFLDRWQQLRREANEKGARGDTAKKQLDDALKSLGLRPRSTVLKHGNVKGDQQRDMRDAGRFAPPADWADQFREYTRGVANQETTKRDQGTGK